MKRSRVVIVLLILLFLILPLYAEDTSDVYEGKVISEIKIEGLKNVKESTASSLVKDYTGQVFSYDLYSEIDTLFYSQSWLDYMFGDIELSAADPSKVVLTLTVHENPLISDVVFTGNERVIKQTLLNSQNLVKGGYYSSNNIQANAALVKEYYISKGYKDATVTGSCTYVEDENAVSVDDSYDGPNKVIVEYTVNEGKQYKVRTINIEGNSGLTTKELKSKLSTKEKSFFNSGNYIESNVTADRETLKQYYATKGYPDAVIQDVRIEEVAEEETDKTIYLTITFVIEENELWTIGSVILSGNEAFSTEELSELISIKEGDLYNSDKINSVYTNLATKYYDNGYVYSQIIADSERDESNHRVNISFDITEGEIARIKEIRINGLTKTKAYVLERELAIKVGDVFSRSAFIQSQQNMYNTSLLKNITANIYPVTDKSEDEEGEYVICEFNVEEGNTMELQFGATFGANEVDGFPVSGFLSLSNSNLFGEAKSLSLSTELSPTTQSVSISLADGWVKDKRWSNSVSFSIARNVRSSTLQRGVASAYYDGRDDDQVTYPFGYNSALEWYTSGQTTPSASNLMKYDNWSFTLGYSSGYSWVFSAGTLSLTGGVSVGLNRAFYDSSLYDPYEVLITKYHEKWQFSNKLSASVNWDARNYVSRTPHGYVASLGYTYAGGFLGGLSNYNKLTLALSMYTGILRIENKEKETAKNLILGFSTEVDFMLPQYWNKDNTGFMWHDAKDGATKYEMLYIDGMNIGRGFAVQTDKAFLWNNQIDLTYPLAEDVISLEGFVSGTAVTSKLKNLSFSALDWYFAAGFGVKMEIPGFPLGLYLVKNATLLSGESFTLNKGSLFNWGGNSGLSLVLAITTSIY